LPACSDDTEQPDAQDDELIATIDDERAIGSAHSFVWEARNSATKLLEASDEVFGGRTRAFSPDFPAAGVPTLRPAAMSKL
jgi:hypothetical protein